MPGGRPFPEKGDAHMSIGTIALIVAAALLFLAGIGANLIPNETTWGYRLPATLGRPA